MDWIKHEGGPPKTQTNRAEPKGAQSLMRHVGARVLSLEAPAGVLCFYFRPWELDRLIVTLRCGGASFLTTHKWSRNMADEVSKGVSGQVLLEQVIGDLRVSSMELEKTYHSRGIRAIQLETVARKSHGSYITHRSLD